MKSTVEIIGELCAYDSEREWFEFKEILINDIDNYYITVNTSLEKGVLFRIYDNLEIFL